MHALPITWWLFWIAAAVVLYTGLIWFFVREATRARPQAHYRVAAEARSPNESASQHPVG